MIGRDRGSTDLKRRIEELTELEARISAMAEGDPLGALFVIRNLRGERGMDEKPLVAKILLRIAEKLDTAIRQDQPEQARVCKTLIQTLVRELEVAQVYDGALVATRQQPDELLEEVSLEESIAALRTPPA